MLNVENTISSINVRIKLAINGKNFQQFTQLKKMHEEETNYLHELRQDLEDS